MYFLRHHIPQYFLKLNLTASLDVLSYNRNQFFSFLLQLFQIQRILNYAHLLSRIPSRLSPEALPPFEIVPNASYRFSPANGFFFLFFSLRQSRLFAFSNSLSIPCAIPAKTFSQELCPRTTPPSARTASGAPHRVFRRIPLEPNNQSSFL